MNVQAAETWYLEHSCGKAPREAGITDRVGPVSGNCRRYVSAVQVTRLQDGYLLVFRYLPQVSRSERLQLWNRAMISGRYLRR